MAMNRERNDQRNSEYNDKVVAIKRVSKTVKGGRTMRFSALVVVGDGKGKEAAMKNIVTVAIDENKSIPHDFTGEYGSAVVLMKRAPEGTGIIAGGPARAVVELAGIQNIRTKSLGSNNKTNVVVATLEGLKAIRSPEEIAKRRGKSVEDILG